MPSKPSEWIRNHPLRFVLSTLWTVLNFFLGALLASSFFWGPLQMRGTTSVLWGSVVGLLNAGLWARQLTLVMGGQERRARRWRLRLLLAPLTIVVVAVLIAGVQLAGLGSLPPLNGDRVRAFERLWETMDRHYAYFDLKGVDWDEVHARYRDRVEAAEDDVAYYLAIGEMLDELHDGHTNLVEPFVRLGGKEVVVFGETRVVSDGVVVTRVGEIAGAAGMEVGDEILSVDGRPVEEALEMWRARLRAGSSVAWERRRASLYLLLATDRDLKVTVEKASSERREFSLVLPEDTPATVTYPEPPPSVTSERLPSGLGLITIRTFGGGPELVRAFDRALDGMMDAPGLIIDVRENNGGMSLLADLMVGRLVEEPFLYGQEFHRARLPQRLWRRRIDYRVLPRGKSYDGPVALLIDTRTYSSGETFAAALTLSDRAYAIGRTTAGATGNPVYVRLPGGKARFSTGDWRYLDGSPLEGLGVRPDLEVAWTVEDLRAGRDPDLAAAEAHLLGVAAE